MRNDTEAVLRRYNISTFGNKKNIERTESMLLNEEKVLYITPTNAIIHSVNTRKKEKLSGIFVLTDKRIVFNYKAGLSEASEIFGLSEIQSVDSSGNGLTGGHISIHTMTKTLDLLATYKKDVMKEIQSIIYNAVAVFKNAGTTSANTGNDNLEQIERLHGLFRSGILTEEEFEAKKRQLLGL